MMAGLHGITTMTLRIATAALLWALALSASAQTVRYIHTDALGSVAVVTDQNRNVVERREYEPYGRQLTPAIKDGPGYTGHVQDAITGLTYMQQRYYDPICGCFLSVDPVTAYDNGDMRFFNRYAYAFNNPYRFTDPDGRAPPGCGDGTCESYDKRTKELAGVLAGAFATFPAVAESMSPDRSGFGTMNVLTRYLFSSRTGEIGNASAAAAKEGVKAAAGGAGSAAGSGNAMPRTASGLVQWAEAQGFTRSQTQNGPIKYSDADGVVRVTIKRGSDRAPGSAGPHVELRNAEGRRVDAEGNSVTRRSPGNHTPIDWDMDP